MTYILTSSEWTRHLSFAGKGSGSVCGRTYIEYRRWHRLGARHVNIERRYKEFVNCRGCLEWMHA